MEWIWILITISILFLLVVSHRLIYIRGYRAGARRVLAEWKLTLQEEEDINVGDEQRSYE